MNSKALAPYLFGTPPTAARGQGIHFFGDKLTVSGPPTDGQPGCEGLVTMRNSARRPAANLQALEERTTAGLDYSATRTSCLTNWGPTFDMSGGGQAAKLAGRRPLDGGVRCPPHLPQRQDGGSPFAAQMAVRMRASTKEQTTNAVILCAGRKT